MKTGNCVRVKNPKSQHYNQKGIAINAAPQFTTVQLFDTNEVVTFPNEALEQTTHVSRPNIESEALKSVRKKIERIKRHVQALEKRMQLSKDYYAKYQTDWARANVKLLEDVINDKREIIKMLHDLLEGK